MARFTPFPADGDTSQERPFAGGAPPLHQIHGLPMMQTSSRGGICSTISGQFHDALLKPFPYLAPTLRPPSK